MYNPLIALILATILLIIVGVLFWPERGLYHRWRQQRRLTQRVLREDALKSIHRAVRTGHRPSIRMVAGDLHISTNDAAELLTDMEKMGFITSSNGDFKLTPAGREAALHIVRAHRMWERYLADRTGYEEEEWHEQADHFEHTLLPAEVDALSAQLGNPTHDPHGDPIPTAAGEMVGHGGEPLSALEVGMTARIVHMEDEPEVVYSQLVAEGLHYGMDVQIIDKSDRRIRFWADGNEHVLSPLLAANISVVPLEEISEEETELLAAEHLANLRPGEKAEVITISQACRSTERRRLMDLGIVPGTKIEVAFKSPSGDPTAYLVRDTLIALREEQARMIAIKRIEEEEKVAA